MKKVLFIAPVLFSLSSFSQNILVNNLGNQYAPQMQSVQVFASNMMVNNANKPARTNANPQVYVQRVSNASGNQRRQIRRTNNVANNISNVTQPLVNVSGNNINEVVQVQENFDKQENDNLGNAFGNENLIEQIASVNIPTIQVGTGSMNLNLDINMPKIKLPAMKFSSRKTVSSSKHKTFRTKKYLAKLNRKMTGKLTFGKKLKIKVDNCFKW